MFYDCVFGYSSQEPLGHDCLQITIKNCSNASHYHDYHGQCCCVGWAWPKPARKRLGRSGSLQRLRLLVEWDEVAETRGHMARTSQ